LLTNEIRLSMAFANSNDSANLADNSPAFGSWLSMWPSKSRQLSSQTVKFSHFSANDMSRSLVIASTQCTKLILTNILTIGGLLIYFANDRFDHLAYNFCSIPNHSCELYFLSIRSLRCYGTSKIQLVSFINYHINFGLCFNPVINL
ncbi:hypothetical protein DERF_011854, partial [Dermatophagoides farinae]